MSAGDEWSSGQAQSPEPFEQGDEPFDQEDRLAPNFAESGEENPGWIRGMNWTSPELGEVGVALDYPEVELTLDRPRWDLDSSDPAATSKRAGSRPHPGIAGLSNRAMHSWQHGPYRYVWP